ncbi:MAG: nodulation protein NfeD [candidate division WOR-3 bacterium]|nr:MAG: nodulation protein NfeD [candidate division WOR-3 bacterium]
MFILFFCVLSVNDVFIADLDGVISPASSSYMLRVIDVAENEEAACVIFKIDTPGGLDASMREICKAILNADVPVVVYVAPSGARAASAGVFILYASHVAVMAPGTNVGAAHPVSMGGEKMDSVMIEKVTNDAVAYLKSLAKERGRNEAWAELSVRESASVDAETALNIGVIDLLADNEIELIERLDGMTVSVSGREHTLKTLGATVRQIGMTLRERLLLLLTNPNIAYVLLLLGIYGLFFELQNPGMIFPGVVGGICLILGFYSLHVLPVNYAGLALIILSAILFILEIYVTSQGLLTIGGIIALVFGSLILFESDVPYLRVSWEVIMLVVIIVAGFVIFLLTLGVRAQFRRRATGSEGLVGEIGTARTDIGPDGGTVFVHGEFWNAVSEKKIASGKKVRVVKVENMTLKVERSEAG